MTTLEGQTVLIVGGSSGIGFGVAKLTLLSNASQVIIASSNKSRVDTAVSRLISDVEKDVPDVADRLKAEVVDAKIGKEVQALMERVGEIDHIVWTAGEAPDPQVMIWPPQKPLEEFKGDLIFFSGSYPH